MKLRAVLMPIVSCLLSSLAGCSSLSLAGGAGDADSATVRSRVERTSLVASLPLRVVATSSVGIADIYLTDLPEQLLRDGGDLTKQQGVIVHIHVFLKPRAGSTPIDPDASSAVTRVFVLTGDGNAGLYAGGGLFTTSDDAGELEHGETYAGRLRGATLYLVRATPGFDDLLGPSTLAGSFGGARDDALAARLALVTQALGERMDEVE